MWGRVCVCVGMEEGRGGGGPDVPGASDGPGARGSLGACGAPWRVVRAAGEAPDARGDMSGLFLAGGGLIEPRRAQQRAKLLFMGDKYVWV